MPTLYHDSPIDTASSPAARLRATMAAVRLSFTWFGVRKTLSAVQKAEAAATFDAEGSFLSAGKKLLDTSHPAYKAVTSLRGRLLSFWRGMSLPFPDAGIRLIRQDDIALFEVQCTSLQSELADAVAILDDHYGELKRRAQNRLGRLFNPADYPSSLRTLFAVSWDYPSVEPPEYLRRLSPALYEQEKSRIAARFDEAVRLAEQAFQGELTKLVSHLCERLTGQDDGKPKIFRDSAIENLNEFFERFRSLSIQSDEQLEQLVEQAQRVIRGIAPETLRENAGMRQAVATQLSAVQATLDGLMVDRPRRNLLRPAREVA